MEDMELRSERIERQALRSLHEHCPADCRSALGLSLDEVDGALAASASADPSILINRAIGLGVESPGSAADVDAVIQAYARRGIHKYFLHVHPDGLEPGVHGGLSAQGLEQGRGWRKFQRAAQAPPEARSELRIERVGSDGARDFGRIVAAAFGMTEAAGPLLAGLASDPRWHLFVSYAGDEAAGAGALMIVGEDAWCEWGATDPNFRRQGSQGAIMVARLRVAIEAGCKYIFTETGEAVDGDPQHSYRNIERYGFGAGALRENWLPAPKTSG